MKMLFTGVAAMVFATAATAQMTGPTTSAPTASAPAGSMGSATPGVVDPAAAPLGTTPTQPSAEPGGPPSSASEMGAMGSASTMLTQRDGKWYNGERAATNSEIAAYKRSKKAGRPS